METTWGGGKSTRGANCVFKISNPRFQGAHALFEAVTFKLICLQTVLQFYCEIFEVSYGCPQLNDVLLCGRLRIL